MTHGGRRASPGVLLVTDAYPPGCGGSGWSTHALAQSLASSGYTVEVLEVDSRSQRSDTRDVDGISVRRIGIGEARTLRRRAGANDYSFDSVRAAVAARIRACPWIRVVHGQHLHSGPGAIAAALAAGLASVVTVRDYWPVQLDGVVWADDTGAAMPDQVARLTGLPRPLAATLVGWGRRRLRARQAMLSRAHGVIAVSAAVRQRLPSIGAPVVVVPNIVDPDRSARLAATLGPDPGAALPETYLLAVGKLNAIKGFDRVVDELADAGCSWPLVVAGTGPVEQSMRARARARGIDLHLVGWTEEIATLRLMRGAKAVVLPSVWEEPLARVILEAMSVGTPVVARATGGSPEVINSGVDGWLFSNPDDLSAALVAIAEPEARARAAAAAVASAWERFAPAVVVPRVMQLYEHAIRESRGE